MSDISNRLKSAIDSTATTREALSAQTGIPLDEINKFAPLGTPPVATEQHMDADDPVNRNLMMLNNENTGPAHGRAALIARAKKLRGEIAQTFADAEHWNATHTPWKKAVDPDGELKRLAEQLDQMLAAEELRQQLESIKLQYAEFAQLSVKDMENLHTALTCAGATWEQAANRIRIATTAILAHVDAVSAHHKIWLHENVFFFQFVLETGGNCPPLPA